MTTDLELVTAVDAQNPTLGDLRVADGKPVMVTGADAIAQEIRVRLRWWRGEHFLDVSAGVPYLQQILGKGVSEDAIRAVLREEIESVPGVGHVESIAIVTDRPNRFATITIDVVTEDGEDVRVRGLELGGG